MLLKPEKMVEFVDVHLIFQTNISELVTDQVFIIWYVYSPIPHLVYE